MSKKNIKELKEKGYEYIIGARVKNESQFIKDATLGLKLQNGDIKVIDKGSGIRLIASMSDKRAKKDAYTRRKGLARLQKRYATGKLTKANINNRGYNKYLKMEGKYRVLLGIYPSL